MDITHLALLSLLGIKENTDKSTKLSTGITYIFAYSSQINVPEETHYRVELLGRNFISFSF